MQICHFNSEKTQITSISLCFTYELYLKVTTTLKQQAKEYDENQGGSVVFFPFKIGILNSNQDILQIF